MALGKPLKLFLAAIGAEGFKILGLDVSTAFLFAWLGDEKVVVVCQRVVLDQGVRNCTPPKESFLWASVCRSALDLASLRVVGQVLWSTTVPDQAVPLTGTSRTNGFSCLAT